MYSCVYEFTIGLLGLGLTSSTEVSSLMGLCGWWARVPALTFRAFLWRAFGTGDGWRSKAQGLVAGRLVAEQLVGRGASARSAISDSLTWVSADRKIRAGFLTF